MKVLGKEYRGVLFLESKEPYEENASDEVYIFDIRDKECDLHETVRRINGPDDDGLGMAEFCVRNQEEAASVGVLADKLCAQPGEPEMGYDSDEWHQFLCQLENGSFTTCSFEADGTVVIHDKRHAGVGVARWCPEPLNEFLWLEEEAED